MMTHNYAPTRQNPRHPDNYLEESPNPSTSTGSLGARPGPGTGSAPGTSTTVPGSPNGTGASEEAHLQLGVRSPIQRTYADRALRIAGRLLNTQGLPIADASLEILQQIGDSTLEQIGDATTSANGTFIASARAGPSRTIEIAYRAFSNDTGYSATAKIVESVQAGVQLTISPHRTSAEGTITLSGRVLGSVPAQGVIVELLVYYHGRWEPFRDPRTDSHGHFRVRYQFQGGVGNFPFRAEVFGNQAAFPFTRGSSHVVDVNTS